MGLLGMQFHLFENECKSFSRREPYHIHTADVEKVPAVNKYCCNISVFPSVRRLPPRHHHPLTVWLRQEAGSELLCPKRRGAPQVPGRPEGVHRGGVGDGADTHRV